MLCKATVITAVLAGWNASPDSRRESVARNERSQRTEPNWQH